MLFYNNNTYQPNLLRLLTQTDYNTLNSSIDDVNSNLTTQINAMKIVYTKITREIRQQNLTSVIYTMPSSARLVIAWAYADINDNSVVSITLGGNDTTGGVLIASKGQYDTSKGYGMGMMGNSVAISIVKDNGNSLNTYIDSINGNSIYVHTTIRGSGVTASIDVSILTFT